jgi:hypothetical protein
MGADLALFGSPRGIVVRDAAGKAVGLDSSFSGLMVRGAEAPRTIAYPRADLLVADARVIATSRDSLRVFFREPMARLVTDTGDVRDTSAVLWTAMLGASGWGDLRRLGVFARPFTFRREISGDPVMQGRAALYAFAQPRSDAFDEVVLVRAQEDSVEVERIHLGFSSISYVTLGVHRGELYMALAASRPRSEGFVSMWLTRLTPTGWSAPALIATGGTTEVTEPRLVSGSGGLVLAWIEERVRPTPVMRWTGVDPVPDAPAHELAVRWPLVRGNPPFQDLLAVQLDDSTAKILELLPTGARELATLESRAFAPVVAGSARRPVALALVSDSVRRTAASQVGIFDLRCLLGGGASPGPR